MSGFFIVLLLAFSALFFGLEPAAQHAWDVTDIKVLGFSLLSPEFRTFLGVGIAFCELVLIFSATSILSMLGNVIGVLKGVLKLIPLLAFCFAAYRAFWPIVTNEIVPAPMAKTFGITQSEAYLTKTANSNSFTQAVTWTLVTLLFFAITNQAAKPKKPKKPGRWGEIFKR